MKPSVGHLYLQILKWRLVAQRDKAETDERLRLEAACPAPAPDLKTLYCEADSMAAYAIDEHHHQEKQ